MKKLLFLIGILLLINTCYADPVTNVNAITYETAINVSWEGTATNYTVALENESIIYTSTSPTIDGVLEEYYMNLSYNYTILTPNPTYTNQLDFVYVLIDDDYEYFGLDAHDNDATSTDDKLRIYIDGDDDGLDADDVMYEFSENGLLKRYRYDAGSWVLYSGSSAIAAVTGEGTSNYQMEVRVPISEIAGVNFTLGKNHRTLFERSHKTPPTVFRYYPHLLCGLDLDNSSTWAHPEYVLVNETGTTIKAVTTDEHYNITGLCPYNWYRAWIYPDGNISETVKVTALTENEEQYTVSGYVYDYDSGEPVFNADVDLIYQGNTIKEEQTNISGYFEIAGLYDLTYTIEASKDNYISDSNSIVSGVNITGEEFYLKYSPTESTSTETSKTDIKIVYILIMLMLVFFAISLLTLYFGDGEVNVVTVFTMAIPSLAAFKISNLFIDGTLIETSKFISSVDTVVTQEEVIRNTAMSNLFELLGIGFIILVLLQIYYYIKDSGVEEELQ